MPLFGLKLLTVIVDRNQAFVTILKRLKLIEILVDYFAVGHSKFNTYTVKIVRSIVASREIDLEELLKQQILDKINGIMDNMMINHQEWCTENLLEIMNEILHQAAELKKKAPDSSKPQEIFDSLMQNFKAFIMLLQVNDVVSVNNIV